LRRGGLYCILSLFLVVAGLAALLLLPADPVSKHHVFPINVAAAAAGFFCSAILGCAGALRMRAYGQALTARIIDICAGGSLQTIDTPASDLSQLASSINDMASMADRAITDANLKAKELEIQLKVATAERQHAEAILYSISDAVLVTDPFDELVLANESAARTFNFDLGKAKASRAPVD
jgi:hypothetical protein